MFSLLGVCLQYPHEKPPETQNDNLGTPPTPQYGSVPSTTNNSNNYESPP